MRKPLVSIIMPAYNVQGTISTSIQSVLDQHYDQWELVIVNDGSTDNTSAIIEQYTGDSRVKIINQKNAGISSARNTGIQHAKGDYIAFLDSDDLWSPKKLKTQIDFHINHPEIKISHTYYSVFDTKSNNKLPFKIFQSTKTKQGLLYPTLCYQNTIGILTVMIKKEVLDHVGLFDTTLFTFEDQELWIRIAKAHYRFGYIAKNLAYYRLTTTGLSGKVGRYKKAYKEFIKKLHSNHQVNTKLVWRTYHRYFGAVYFKNQQYKLSLLHCLKSFSFYPYDLTGLSNMVYITLSIFKKPTILFSR
jgi:glycosyltransferase involved in cell wall biosynthesis